MVVVAHDSGAGANGRAVANRGLAQSFELGAELVAVSLAPVGPLPPGVGGA